MDEADLDRMLTGVDGVLALDAARAIRALRAECTESQTQTETMRTAMLKHQETAELLMHEKAEACQRFNGLLDTLANMLASARA